MNASSTSDTAWIVPGADQDREVGLPGPLRTTLPHALTGLWSDAAPR